MKKMILTALLLSSTVVSAQEMKLELECTRSKVAGNVMNMDIIDDAKPTSDESVTKVTKIEIPSKSSGNMTTYASGKSISTDGSLDDLDLEIRALSKMTSSTDSCYKRGSEMRIEVKGNIGGKGTGGVYLFEVQELPRFKAKNKNAACSIPKPSIAKPYRISCTVTN